MLQLRSSGLLLHITSLPSAHGVGDLGPAAYQFADFLARSGQTYWQILPLTPLDPGAGFSPYSSPSAFAGNTLMISFDRLVEQGLLPASDVAVLAAEWQATEASMATAWSKKQPLLRKAAETFIEQGLAVEGLGFDTFCYRQEEWLEDYALFVALQQDLNIPIWTNWPDAIVRRDTDELARQTERLAHEILVVKVQQYLFYQQWNDLITYCYARKIHLIGDIPIYVQQNSADVWANKELFKLDESGMPRYVAGSPPDYFSADGQRWGNPIYDWAEHERTGFTWWIRRMRHQMSLYSLTRLDHFLGFDMYWEIPSTEPTAKVGQWVQAPTEAFIHAMYRQFVQLPLIAEDLGARSAEIQPFLRHYAIPGMRVVQFGFGDDLSTSSHIPHNHTLNNVVYTGTHDNNTSLGWYRQGEEAIHTRLNEYTGVTVTEENVVALMSRMAMQSVARLAILPVQDILSLNEEHRMNTPGLGGYSWQWRLQPGQLTDEVSDQLLALTKMTGRV
ncbi:MAG: 4-alpha-glucanotransferase [Cytophagaceae bacterium]|nr:MAG: 4-alpha-glucanotransferase [Cytophagaceae bacterium]